MIDQEKIIKALDCCLDIVRSGRWASGCIACPYAAEENSCREKMIMDALALLKEQPEIVRCKDCIHWDNLTKFCGTHSSCFTVQRTLPDWFCADGERR